MMIEKSGTIRLKDIHIPQGGTPEQQELAQGMVRVNHLYRSALKVAVTQLEILDEEFASLYEHQCQTRVSVHHDILGRRVHHRTHELFRLLDPGQDSVVSHITGRCHIITAAV